MKAKFIIVTLVFGAAITILGVVAFWKFGRTSQDNRQREFVKRAGFLTSQDSAITSYAEAIEIFRQHGIDIHSIEKHRAGDQNPIILNTASNKFIKFIVRGAKAKRLGIKVKRPEPFTIEIYTPDNKRFEFENFKLLSKVIAHFAEVELTQKGDMDKAVLLGNVNLALGIQLSAYYNVDFIYMYGIACKDLGLQTLEECAKAQHDENLTNLVLEMRQECDKEFEIVRNMPATTPSSWDFFRQCMKPEPDVNEPD